jgi:hypothetical protein
MTGLVARRILETPEGMARYHTTFRALFETLFQSPRISQRAREILGELRGVVSAVEFRQIQEESAELCARIVAREASLREQLNKPAPQQFDGDFCPLVEWRPVDISPGVQAQSDLDADGRKVLRLLAGRQSSASWRTSVFLKPGHYRFRGDVKIDGVKPLDFGKNHGAGLRVAGLGVRSNALIGNEPWTSLEVEFNVASQPTEVELICELRANAGQALFDRSSLALQRCR